jgi:acyl-coenzyme A synthetase/AMP-(fatty) acid ligase
LAKTKWPEKLVVIETLPRNALNKVVRAELKNQSVIWEEAAF